MNIKRITTIVPRDDLERIERCLRSAGVPRMTIENVRGFGEHANYFSSDLLRSNVRIEVYIGSDRCDEICAVICGFARQAHAAAGILAVESVDRLIDLNTGEDIPPDHLGAKVA